MLSVRRIPLHLSQIDFISVVYLRDILEGLGAVGIYRDSYSYQSLEEVNAPGRKSIARFHKLRRLSGVGLDVGHLSRGYGVRGIVNLGLRGCEAFLYRPLVDILILVLNG